MIWWQSEADRGKPYLWPPVTLLVFTGLANGNVKYTVSRKKGATTLLFITLLNANWLSKLFQTKGLFTHSVEQSGVDTCRYTHSVNIIIVFSEFDLCMQCVSATHRSVHSLNATVFNEFDKLQHTHVSAWICTYLHIMWMPIQQQIFNKAITKFSYCFIKNLLLLFKILWKETEQ